jgi:uncharacterized protein (TIGR02453 family)
MGYFDAETFAFLKDLAAHNDREWFAENKDRYEESVKEPFLQFISDVGPELRKVSTALVADPRPNGGSMFRIYRDVRFSKDKSPYKTNLGASFPWVEESADDDATARSHTSEVHSSGGYFHLQPGEIYVGGGIWHPDKPWIDAFRQRVAKDPDEVRGLIEEKGFKKTFGKLSDDGHSLQRVPQGYAADHPAADLLKMKDVVFGRRLSDTDAESPSLPDILADTYAAAVPMFRYLASIG